MTSYQIIDRLFQRPASLVVMITCVIGVGGCSDAGPEQVSSETSQFRVADESVADATQGDDQSELGASDSLDSSSARTGSSRQERLADEKDRANALPADLELNAARSPQEPSRQTGSSPTEITSGRSAASPNAAESNVTVEQLLDQISQIEQSIERRAIPGSTREQQEESFRRMIGIRREAAERILATDATPEQQMMAKLARLDSLSIQVSLGVGEAMSELADYARTLMTDENREIRLAASRSRFQILRMNAAVGDEQSRQEFDDLFAEVVESDDDDLLATGISARIELLMQLADQGTDGDASAELESYLEELMASDNARARFTAVNAKLTIFDQMIDADLPGARGNVEAFATALQDDADPEIAEMVRLTLFSLKMRDIHTGDTKDPATLLEALQTLLANSPKTPTLFESARVAITVLQQTGHVAASNEALDQIVSAFRDHEDERLAQAAESLALQGALRNFNFLVNAVLNPEVEGDAEAMIASATSMLNQDANASKLVFVGRAAESLEYSGNIELAKTLYDMLGSVYGQHEDFQMRERAQELVENANKRLGLIGQRLELTGMISSGQEFDWEAYRGKVVLVDFWATWCTPCQEELPNILENYQQYQAEGFEVVGVNIDENQEKARRFIDAKKIPWQNIVADSNGINPNADRYHIQAIPFVILVTRDGHVDSLHTRGPALGPAIERLLAQPAATETTSSVPGGDNDLRFGQVSDEAAETQ